MNKITLVVAVVCLAIIGIAGVAISSRNARQAQIEELLTSADQAAQSDSQLAQAESQYREAQELDPENTRADEGLKYVMSRQAALKNLQEGKRLLTAGAYSGAEKALKKCFDVGPLAEASLVLGEVYERQNRPVDAQAAYESAEADSRADKRIKDLAASKAKALSASNTSGESRVQSIQEFLRLTETQDQIAKQRNYSSPELTPTEVASVTYDYLEQIDQLSGGLQSQAARARALRLSSGTAGSGVLGGEYIGAQASKLLDTWVSSQSYTSDGRGALAQADTSALSGTPDSPELQALAANPPGTDPELEGAVVVRVP